MDQARQSFDVSAWTGDIASAPFTKSIDKFKTDLKYELGYDPEIEIQASPFGATQIVEVNGKIHCYISNFKGLKANETATQLPEQNVTITFPAKRKAKVFMLPFLGEVQLLSGEWKDGKMTVQITEIKKGVVVWCE